MSSRLSILRHLIPSNIGIRVQAILSAPLRLRASRFSRHSPTRKSEEPHPPEPPFDIETFEPIEPPWQAIREWIPAHDGDPGFDLFDQRAESWKPVQIPREDGCILVLDLD